MTSWNPLGKRPYLTSRPLLSQNLCTHLEDRDLAVAFARLQELEDHAKRIYKEVKRYEECLQAMRRIEHKMASELCNSQVCKEEEPLRKARAEAFHGSLSV